MNSSQVPNTIVKTKRHTSRWLAGVLVFWIVAALLFLSNQRAVLDWLQLRGYAPSSSVAALASADTMTPQAIHAFYVNRPSIDTKSTFSTHCNFATEQSIVLGCYHGNQQGIYILSVSDARLQGVEQVTAAHEMLHAAYDRLSSKERAHIDGLLQDFYNKNVSDARVRATIDQYRKTEPNDVVNEMHSIFGTELAQLTPALQTYYSRYFTDRLKVVSYAAAYSNEFTSRQQQVAAYDAELKTLKSTIEANTTELSQEQSSLQSARQQLDAERASNPGQYNSDVDSYNARVNAYNAKIAATRELINRYNDIVDKRNALAFEEQQLVQAISGNAVPSAR